MSQVDVNTDPTQRQLHIVSVFLIFSAIIFCSMAHYQYTVERNNEQALIFASIGIFQWLVVLFQPDVRSVLQSSGTPAQTPVVFMWNRWRRFWILVGFAWMVAVFQASWGEEFTPKVMVLWISGILYWWLILSEPGYRRFQIARINIPVNFHTLLFAVAFLLGAFFLYYHLDQAPDGMTADHAEKIFDLLRMEQGTHSIYFGANSGREPLHFYLSFAASRFFGYSFLSLKHASAFIGLLMLPALYWMGRQIEDDTTGLLAMAFGAFCVWQMILARSGFRAWSAALAAALLLGCLWRALHTGRRTDFLLTGLVLGAGLYTYTAFRIAPVFVVVGLAVRWWELDAPGRKNLFRNGLALVALAAMVYMPLFSYSIRYPHTYWYRSQQMVGLDLWDNIRLLIEGFIDSITMFNITPDPVTLNVIPEWGALGPITGALFVLGVVLWTWRIFQNRRLLELLPLLALIIFTLPSALAVSAPNEMPSARRAVTAFPVAMFFSGYALSFAVSQVWILRPRWILRPVAMLCCLMILFAHASSSWDAFFNIHVPSNATRTQAQLMVADQIRQFEREGGTVWDAYLLFESDFIWVDPRIVAMEMGLAGEWDNVIVVDEVGGKICTVEDRSGERSLMYLYSTLASDDLENFLERCFPQYIRYVYYYPGTHIEMFKVLWVPARNDDIKMRS